MSNYVITIGRQYGCGGRKIGREIADKLGIAYYDKEIVKGMIAEDCGVTKEAVSEFMEKRTSSLLYEMAVFAVMGPLEEKVFISQTKIVKQLAEKSSCVFVGVCADYILRDYDRLFKVFLKGDVTKRLVTVKEQHKDIEDITERDLKTADRKRASYYNFFTTQKWGEKDNYDLIADISLGKDVLVNMISSIAGEKFGGK